MNKAHGIIDQLRRERFQRLCDRVESLIDTYNAREVLDAVAHVCTEKAEYVASGGSHGDHDSQGAKAWEAVSEAADKAARRASAVGV